MAQKILFIDRDGTLIKEPTDEQVDSFEKLEFMPGVFRNLYYIKRNLNYRLVIVSNQDGLGTTSYPQKKFDTIQKKILTAFENEEIHFDDILIDNSLAKDKSPYRKPGTGLLKKYLGSKYDIQNSFVIGDRYSDIELAKNIGCKGILISSKKTKASLKNAPFKNICCLIAESWNDIYPFLANEERTSEIKRKTRETEITVKLSLNGDGKSSVSTGLGFFDHMLDQIARHSGMNIAILAIGDLKVDEHHTIEDTALVLGEAINNALGNKKGIERYGFTLPMDDSLARVAIDFSGRSWLVWDVEFKREKVGDIPTEMFFHFFKSFSDAAKCNLNIKAEGNNEHHKIEAIFKAFARSIKMAIKKDNYTDYVPSTKDKL